MKHIRVGVIGGGGIAKAHVIGLRGIQSYFGNDEVRAEVRVIVDASADAARRAATQYGVDRWTAELDEVLSDPAIDAVTIATPNDSHGPIAIAAARAGKHVMCEKPLAHDLRTAVEMAEAAERAGIVHSVNLTYRSVPAIGYARSLIAAGELGEILSVRAAFLQDWGADPLTPRSWKFEAARAGGGPILSLGCHAIDLATYLVGDVARVVASSRTVIGERPHYAGGDTYAAAQSSEVEPVDVEDLAVLLLQFDGGAIGTMELSRVAPGRRNYFFLEISGTRGSIVFDYERLNEIQVWTQGLKGLGFSRVIIGPEHDGGLIWTLGGLGVGFADTIVVHLRNWARAIVSGAAATPSFVDGLRAQEVVHAAMQSAAGGGWETVERHATGTGE